MAKGLPGYPSNKNLQRQAAQLAGGAVPTKRSIRRQYALPIQSNQGFTEALIHLLQQGGGATSAGFDQAIASQQGIDQAAAARLAALGGPYGAGSAAAVGGMGGSALSSLVAQGAAAKNYAGQMPAVAASRGQQMNAQLVQQRNQALTQRGEDYRSALQQALQTVQQNALAMSSLRSSNKNAAMDRVLQQQQMAQQNAQFQASQAQQAAGLAEQQREFNYEHSPQWLGLQAQIQAAASGQGGKGNPLSQWTPGQISTFQRTGSDYANTAVLHGMPINQAIRNIIMQRGVPRQIAVAEAQSAYSQMTKPTLADVGGDSDKLKAAMAAYNRAWPSYTKWAKASAFRKWLSKQPKYVKTPPGAHGPGR